MPERPVTLALIGAGYTAREHIRAFAAVPGAVVAGIHSRTRSRAEALAREFGIPLVCDSVSELYERTRADLVVVTVAEMSMNAVSQACFEHPWTVLLEKPPGHHLEEALEIQAAAAARGRRVFVALNRRFLSTTRAVQADLAAAPGPRFIKVQDQQSQARAREAGQPARVVQNWMFANSIHTIDYFRIFGRGAVLRIEPIQPWDADAPGVVLARVLFDSGDIGLYEGIWHGPGPWAVSVTVPGKRWELRPLEQMESQELGRPPVRIVPHPWDAEFKPGFRAQAEAAVRAAREEPSEAVTLADALETMRLVASLFGGDGGR